MYVPHNMPRFCGEQSVKDVRIVLQRRPGDKMTPSPVLDLVPCSEVRMGAGAAKIRCWETRRWNLRSGGNGRNRCPWKQRLPSSRTAPERSGTRGWGCGEGGGTMHQSTRTRSRAGWRISVLQLDLLQEMTN